MMHTSRGKFGCCWKATLALFCTATAGGQTPVLESPEQLPIETSACQGVMQPIPFAADWNNDGRKDLLVGEMKWSKVRLFLNAATDAEPFFPDYEHLQAGEKILSGGGCNSRACPQVVDWDNDGRKDLIAGTTTGYVNLYRNIGAGALPVLQRATVLEVAGAYLNVGHAAAPCVTDWNADGKKDLLAGCEAGTIFKFLNINTDEQPVPDSPSYVKAAGETLTVEGGTSSPKHVDWDGDGVRDLLVGCGAGKVFFYRNLGTDTDPVFAAGESLSAGGTELNVGGNSSIDVIDWNNDGGLDLLVGSKAGYIYVIRRSPPADTDEDGLPDPWEAVMFGDLSHGPQGDDDVDLEGRVIGDGQTNRQEYIAGTDPTDPQDVLRVTAKMDPATREVSLSWLGRSGKTYQLLWSDLSGDMSWLAVQWPVMQRGFGGTLCFKDQGTNTYGDSEHSPGSPGVRRRFYWVTVVHEREP